MSLSGRIGLVTGAGRGIGKTTARVLCENGMAVGVNDIDSAAAAATAAELRAAGHTALACAGDVTMRLPSRRSSIGWKRSLGHCGCWSTTPAFSLGAYASVPRG